MAELDPARGLVGGASSNHPVRLGGLAAAVGKGLTAGMVGTAAMTVSSTLEAKLRAASPARRRRARRARSSAWRRCPATIAHLAAVWGGEQVVLPATGAGSPATQWEPKEVAVDLWHHLVYVTAAGVAYTWLDRR